MSEAPLRYTFIFTPPEDDAACWNLALASFAERLQASFPDSDSTCEGGLGPREAEVLSFELAITPGEWLDGMVSTPLPQSGSVVLYLATPTEAAAFAAWLRDSYVPEGAPIEAVTELAMVNGIEDVRVIPSTGDLTDIVRALEEHVDEVEGQLAG